MKEFEYVVTDPVGIHARPATLLTKLAGTFTSSITIGKGDREVSAKKIIAVMSLGAKAGEKIVIKAEGEDEEKAAEALESFLKENL